MIGDTHSAQGLKSTARLFVKIGTDHQYIDVVQVSTSGQTLQARIRTDDLQTALSPQSVRHELGVDSGVVGHEYPDRPWCLMLVGHLTPPKDAAPQKLGEPALNASAENQNPKKPAAGETGEHSGGGTLAKLRVSLLEPL